MYLQESGEDPNLPDVSAEDAKREAVLEHVREPKDAAGRSVVRVAKIYLDAVNTCLRLPLTHSVPKSCMDLCS